MTGPDLAALLAAGHDESGARLAAVVRAAHGGNGTAPEAPLNGARPTPAQFMAQAAPRRPWDDVAATLAAEGRNNGVMRLAASLRETTSLTGDQAVAEMYARVWPLIDQAQGGHEFPAAEFEEVVRAVWREYPGAADRVQAAAAAAADLAAHPLPGNPLELTDAYITDRVARILASSGMAGRRYCWARGLGWMKWDTRRWVFADESEIWDETRQYFIWLHSATARAGADQQMLARLTALLSKARITAVASLARGHREIIREADDFDAHPDVVNTPGGIVSLRDGTVSGHDPAMLLTKITAGSYRPGFTHADWAEALTALDEPERLWYQHRIGQAITGYPPPDGVMPVLQGSGENGKSCLTTDGPVVALGGYADMASPKLISSQRSDRSEHSTELADLRGQRLLIGEELTEGRSIDVTVLKRIQDVGRIKARLLYKDNITFTASHSLFVTTNYLPVINETDHGTWRRLALVVFPYTYRKPGTPLVAETDREGDPGLKQRVREGAGGQHDAIVTWAVEGAMRWYAAGRAAPVTAEIAAATLRWRARTDYVLSFWNDRLEAGGGAPGSDPPCVSTSHLCRVFNAWIAESGHHAWPNETFAARFGSHELTTANRVHYVTTTRLGSLSQDTVSDPQEGRKRPPKQLRVWMGVRFKTPAEQEVYEQVDGVDALLPTLLRRSSYEKVDRGASTPSTPLEAECPNTRRSTVGAYPGTSTESSQNPAHAAPPKQKTRKPHGGPDPQLEGALLSLPAVVTRDGTVTPCAVEDAAALLGTLGSALTVDVETTGYPPGHPEYQLRTVQLGDARLAAVFDAGDEASRLLIRAQLAAAEVLHAHSAAADLVPLELAGLCGEDAWGRMHDTVLSAKLADPEMSGSDADGLKELARDVLGDRAVTTAANEARKKLFMSGRWLTDTGAVTPRERSGWAQVNPACETMIRYAASDVLDTAALPAALPAPDPLILARERQVQRICARVTRQGLRLDGAHVRALIGAHESGKAAAAEQVRGYGVDNPGSALQVAAALTALGAAVPRTAATGKFPGGQPSVTGAVLDALAGEDEAGLLAGAVLEYREHATILGLTLEPFRLLCDRGDSRVRPAVYTLGTSTGRMSCVRPNLQQIKRTGGIRACVTADEGTVLISADFAGVELRVAAALSGDAALREFIAEEDASRGGDAKVGLHWKIAQQVWGPAATKKNRYAVKRAVFGHIYGGSARAMANGAGISLADAEAVKATLSELTPQLMRWSADWSTAVRDRRAVSFEAWGGRQVWFDKRAPHKAGNYAIQGTARELLCAALLKWAGTAWGGSVILPVHDEILAVVPEADGPAATAELVRCMETDLYGVPVMAEPSAPSFAWQDAE